MTIITDTTTLAELCKSLARQPFITVDTEFLREKTYYPKLCLIQISGPDKQAALVDPLAPNMDLSPLFDLLGNENIFKIFHAARQDLEIFFNLTGRVVKPFFDTQIAAMVCGYGDSVSYDNLVRGITGHQMDKSSQFTDWSQRPLSEKQIKYAMGDVTHLCDVYTHLKTALEKRSRTSWVYEEEEFLANPATYDTDPCDCWQRIKIRSPKPQSLAVLRELAAWRERAAQKKNIPRTWMMRDETLADLAAQAPRDKAQLARIRNFPKDAAEGRTGEAVLEAIRKALESPKADWPSPDKRNALSSQAQAITDILKMLLKLQATEHEVAAKLIASPDDIEQIALDDNADVRPLKGWRREIFGEEALALKHGKLGIGMKDGRMKKFPVSDL